MKRDRREATTITFSSWFGEDEWMKDRAGSAVSCYFILAGGRRKSFWPERKNSPNHLQVIRSLPTAQTVNSEHYSLLSGDQIFPVNSLTSFLFHITMVIFKKTKQKTASSQRLGQTGEFTFAEPVFEFKWATLDSKTWIHAGILMNRTSIIV